MSIDTTIDLRIGEARTIRDITCKLFNLEHIALDMSETDWEYQPFGYQPLVSFLEEKHSAKVIITNGANQALHAAMYALKTKGFNNIGIRLPYWNRIPEIAKHIGIECTPFEGQFFSEKKIDIDSYLLTIPNNPDGFLPSLDVLRSGMTTLKNIDIPLVHDAVYYNKAYLPIDYPIEAIGDIQLFSASKTYGLSSLRVGYIVVYNASFHKPLKDYMEFSTVGVSIPAQKLFLHILQREKQLPFLADNFNKLAREEVKKAKQTFKKINPELVEIPETFDKSCGLFAWVKPKVPNIFEQVKVEVLKGDIFGMPEFVRINLAAGHNVINEVVRRVNDIA